MSSLIVADYRIHNRVSETDEKVVVKTEAKVINQKDKVIKKLLETMTLEEKVGQLFLGRVSYNNQIEDIQTYHIGGYILFGKDFDGQT